MIRKLAVELMGTFFLVLTIALSGNPLAIGVVLMSLVYMGGYISGAHYNPAVTIAVFLQRKLTPATAAAYIGSQLLGGAMAAGAVFMIQGTQLAPAPAPSVTWMNALVLEGLFTFLLASVVLHTAVAEQAKGNQYYGLAIGGTVLAAAFSAGAISGGAFNPAVAVGPLLLKGGTSMDLLVLYTLGPVGGGVLAGLVYRWLRQTK